LNQSLLVLDDDGQESALQLALGIGDLVTPQEDGCGLRGDTRWGGDTTTDGYEKRRVKRRKSKKRKGEGELTGHGTSKVNFRNHLMSSLSIYKTTLN
jgi:hypothetical protein